MKIAKGTLLFTLAIVLLYPGRAAALDEGIFTTAIERAVDQVVTAWLQNDEQAMEEPLEQMTLNEAYLMVVEKGMMDRTYLGRVPKSLSGNYSRVAAYLYLLRLEREGVDLKPSGQFEGRHFDFRERRIP